MEATFLDLRKNMKSILSALDRNETVTILYRGKKKALLCPITNNNKPKKRVQDYEAFGMWADREDMADVEAYIRGMRQRRKHGI